MLGVGATKAGTSWLHGYLSGHPDCHLRTVKELHYFDARDLGARDEQLAQLALLRDRLTARLSAGDSLTRQLADIDDLRALLETDDEDIPAYLAYLMDGRGTRAVVGEVTPAYCLLSEARLRGMAEMAPDVRFIYLMRDPVARLWSHVRMIAQRRAGDVREIPARASYILRTALAGADEALMVRADYAAHLARLTAAVRPDRLLLMFYEELFSEAGIGRLCRFLGIGPHPADFTRRVHDGVPVTHSDSQHEAMCAALAPQYRAVRAVMGRLPAAWEHKMVKV